MFDILLICRAEELQKYAEEISHLIKIEQVETFIRTLWKRVPELTVEQEKELHIPGRNVLMRFEMKRIRA